MACRVRDLRYPETPSWVVQPPCTMHRNYHFSWCRQSAWLGVHWCSFQSPSLSTDTLAGYWSYKGWRCSEWSVGGSRERDQDHKRTLLLLHVFAEPTRSFYSIKLSMLCAYICWIQSRPLPCNHSPSHSAESSSSSVWDSWPPMNRWSHKVLHALFHPSPVCLGRYLG